MADVKRDATRRVDFPEAGEGCYLLLRNAGIRTLRSIYEDGHILKVEEAFALVNVDVLERLLSLMVWRGDEKVTKTFDDFDDISVSELIEKLRDGWSLSLNGRTYAAQVEYVRGEIEKEKERQEKRAPLGEPETSGSSSGPPPTDPA